MLFLFRVNNAMPHEEKYKNAASEMKGGKEKKGNKSKSNLNSHHSLYFSINFCPCELSLLYYIHILFNILHFSLNFSSFFQNLINSMQLWGFLSSSSLDPLTLPLYIRFTIQFSFIVYMTKLLQCSSFIILTLYSVHINLLTFILNFTCFV